MNLSDFKRNAHMLRGSLSRQGYVRWWHSFIGVCPDTLESRTFFIEFFVINPALSSEQPILGRKPYNRRHGLKPSYVMVKAGVFPDENGKEGRQLHAFYPVAALKAAPDPLYVQVEDCFFSENRTCGSVEVSSREARRRSLMSDAGSMEWELEMHKAIACHTGIIASCFFTALNALDSFWHGEGIRTFFRGTVTLDGVTYQVSPDSSFGYADKHWGRKYNSPWLQFASSRLVSQRTGKALKHSALALDGCCPRLFWFPLKRRLIVQLTYTGEDFEYNFAKPHLLSRCRWKIKRTNKRYIWQISARNKTSLIKISCSSLREQMMPLDYESPDGSGEQEPLWAGACGAGVIELYRRIPGGLQLIDRLTIESGLCEYQETAK